MKFFCVYLWSLSIWRYPYSSVPNLQKIGPSDILDQIWTDDLDNGKSNDFTVMW